MKPTDRVTTTVTSALQRMTWVRSFQPNRKVRGRIVARLQRNELKANKAIALLIMFGDLQTIHVAHRDRAIALCGVGQCAAAHRCAPPRSAVLAMETRPR